MPDEMRIKSVRMNGHGIEIDPGFDAYVIKHNGVPGNTLSYGGNPVYVLGDPNEFILFLPGEQRAEYRSRESLKRDGLV